MRTGMGAVVGVADSVPDSVDRVGPCSDGDLRSFGHGYSVGVLPHLAQRKRRPGWLKSQSAEESVGKDALPRTLPIRSRAEELPPPSLEEQPLGD